MLSATLASAGTSCWLATAVGGAPLAHPAAVCSDAPPNPAVRAELHLLARADAAALQHAVLRHFELDTPTARHPHDTELSDAVTETCRRRDVDLSVAKAMAVSDHALSSLDENTRLAASVAFRDVFLAMYTKSTLSKTAYHRAIAGFEAPLPVATCTDPDSGASIAGKPVQAEYPELAKEQGAAGTTLVQVNVDVTGNATSGRIFKSSGNTALDQSALEAAAATRYNPAMADCAKRAGSVLFRADFGAS
jgi:TonB family protein